MNYNEKIRPGRNEVPCVPLRDIVVFPGMTVHFDVGREFSVRSIKYSMNRGELVFLVTQRNSDVEYPGTQDLYKYGTFAVVRQIVKTPGGVYRCVVEGVRKGRLYGIRKEDGMYVADAAAVPNFSREKLSEKEADATMRELKRIFEDYASFVPKMPKQLYESISQAETLPKLTDELSQNLAISVADKQQVLERASAGEKAMILIAILARETEVLALEIKIHQQVQNSLDKNQRDYYIREQIRMLQKELGEADSFSGDDLSSLEEKINALSGTGSEEAKEKLSTELDRLKQLPAGSQEGAVIRTYIETVLSLPWDKRSEDNTDIALAAKMLDEDHYGMKRVKDRIVENLSVMKLTNGTKGQIICLYGPPGVGKTSVGKSIARALGRKYVRVSLGGIHDESDIRGHRKTYVGAMPGRIINALIKAGTVNPVMLLDEIDKMGNSFHGDPASAMLEVLDSEQNVAFRDHYIELPTDLSQVMFITTANSLDTIAPPLLDRMEVIELSSYTREEKFEIAKRHLIPKQLKENGLKAAQLRITDDAVYALIDSYTREAGVRKLERSIASLCRKAARKLTEGTAKRVTVKGTNITEFLGHKKYLDDEVAKSDEVGLVNGLAWTSVGGVIMPLEVLVLDGKGKIELTGSLGDVMKESARIAVSLARKLSDKYGISPDFYEKKDLHIHAPEGAVPKDGPSAGVTMTTALISALSGIPVRADVAMTGEITLRGKVLPIGGLREKTMAAYKAGIKTVIVPKDNQGDLDEIDEVVKLGLEFVFAENIEDVLETALVKSAGKPKADIPYELVKKPVRRAKKASV